MKFPKCQGFDIVCGDVITVFLDDFITVTGKFLGEIDKPLRHRRRLVDFHEFILVQLVCPICEKGAPEIPKGTFVAINIDRIQFIVPGLCCQGMPDDKYQGECHAKKHDDKFIVWDDTCHEDTHIINISCKRKDDRQHVINISCNGEEDKNRDDG